MSYFVAEQRTETGIRVALGASGSKVVQLVLGRSARTVAVGIVLGAGGAFATHRVLRALIVDMADPSPATLFGIFAALVAATFFASVIPALRAARTDPAEVLQSE